VRAEEEEVPGCAREKGQDAGRGSEINGSQLQGGLEQERGEQGGDNPCGRLFVGHKGKGGNR